MSRHVICHDINYNWFQNTFMHIVSAINNIMLTFFKNIDININNKII